MDVMARLAAAVCGRRAKWLVVGFWIAVMALSYPLSAKLMGAQDNDAASWLPGDAESTRVVELQQEAFATGDRLPRRSSSTSGQGGITADDTAVAAAQTAEIGALDNVPDEVVGPVPSRDGEALQVIAPRSIPVRAAGSRSAKVVDEMTEIIGDTPDGLSAYVTDRLVSPADFAEAFDGIDTTLLYSAMAVVIVILLLSYRSPVMWLFPGDLRVRGAHHRPGLLCTCWPSTQASPSTRRPRASSLVLVFGASTDYALLIVARYREELRRHEDRHEAMAFGLRRASPAIIASAATVAVGMLCLLAAQMNSTRRDGPGNSPSASSRACWSCRHFCQRCSSSSGAGSSGPSSRATARPSQPKQASWARIGQRIARRPRAVWIGTVICARCHGARPGQPGHRGAGSTRDSFVDKPAVHRRRGGVGPGTSRPERGLPVARRPPPGQRLSRWPRRLPAPTEIAEVGEPVVVGDYAFVEGTLESRSRQHGGPGDRRSGPGRAFTRFPDADALVGGNHGGQPRMPSGQQSATAGSSCRWYSWPCSSSLSCCCGRW